MRSAVYLRMASKHLEFQTAGLAGDRHGVVLMINRLSNIEYDMHRRSWVFFLNNGPLLGM
jgi:hypothetical protein